MTNFVFVHGAFHGGWCFDKLRPSLEAAGHRLLTPTLTGVGERSHLSALGPINLDTHILDIANLITWRDLDNVVLCGHSYGCLVITGVADQLHDRIASLVYLDGPLPEKSGDSLFSLLPNLLLPFTELSASLGGTQVANWPSKVFGVGEEHQAWADSKLTSHPLACFTQQLSLTGKFKQVPKKVFIYNSKDIGIPSPIPGWYEAQRDLPETHVYSLDGGHDLMIDKASEVAEILLKHA
ncbi:alpha/beta fold hydrolase [Paraburkholderia unamae]|uniref:Pimeloyl-ACP methyl ester carboxylesterase n=2 Tax=Paraburkholderia TaxID=1822464 RepID=A0ABX5KPI4_9BURK|nr:alpha/beta hydrolase [Paraburkholderia unamae]PVX83276.1 pimeloyl-ACP methyl ester carboxylesterase [Paraburkholderia unamae]QNB17508.1 alpha/beta hydrolase [Paraburkholderia tropica]